MNTIKEIIIKEEYIEITGMKIYPPFSIDDFIE